MTAKQEEAAVAWTSECIGLLGPTDGIVLHYARRKVQSSTCIPVGMHTEALAPPKPTGINSTNWTWFGSWQTSVPYRSSTFLGRGTWISRSIAFSLQTMSLSSMKTNTLSRGCYLYSRWTARFVLISDINNTLFGWIIGRARNYCDFKGCLASKRRDLEAKTFGEAFAEKDSGWSNPTRTSRDGQWTLGPGGLVSFGVARGQGISCGGGIRVRSLLPIYVYILYTRNKRRGSFLVDLGHRTDENWSGVHRWKKAKRWFFPLASFSPISTAFELSPMTS